MTTMRKMRAIMQLNAVPFFGPARIRKVLNQLLHQDTPLELLIEFGQSDLVQLGMTDEQADEFVDTDMTEIAEIMEDRGVSLLVSTDDDAPKRMSDPRVNPWFFYYGDPNFLNAASIGFSGSRDASEDALRVTREITAAASGRGWAVVSGGARGVDMTAHVSAVEAGGTTIVLLAQGFSSWRMPDDLVGTDTLVLSQFMPFDDWGNYRAMQRNKNIVHLSDCLVIPQSGVRGGTWNAAEYALKQGHPTWIVDLGQDYPGNQAVASAGAATLDWSGDSEVLDRLVVRPLAGQPPLPTLH